MNLKLWYGLGLAGLLGLVGLGSANLGGALPMTTPLPEGGTTLTSLPTPELQTFTAGGHVLGFAPRYLLTASGHHGLKVEFLNAQPVIPQSDTPAATGQESPAPPLTQVRYPNLWDGIDLSYHAAPGGIAESLYRLQPGADINQVRLRYNRPLNLTADGRLSIRFDTGVLSESAPIAWQEVDGQRLSVSVSFVQHGERELGFTLGEHDPSRPLWIDPTLSWNTFLGGSGSDAGNGLAVDGSGNIYVTGSSSATWGNPLRAHSGGYDAFVAKLDPDGALLWNTFLGGSGDDLGEGVALDGSGHIFVTGRSNASWGSPLREYGGGYCGYRVPIPCTDAFAARLDADGALLWNVFLGGSQNDFGYGIAVDGSGHVYVTGGSGTTWGNPVRTHSGAGAFVAKLDPNGALLWHSFLGGSDGALGYGIALDGSGHIYVTGDSFATWGSPLRAHSGGYDAFVAKLDAHGELLWNTFLGNSGYDSGRGIALDDSDHVYVTGGSDATWGSPLRTHSGGACGSAPGIYPCIDAFVAQIDADGALLWNSFLGGSHNDFGYGLAINANGNLSVTGYSSATWASPLQPYSGGTCGDGYTFPCPNAFVAQLNLNGFLLWNTFLGSETDSGKGIALKGTSHVYVTGWSLATWGAPLRAHNGNSYDDAFVAKLGLLTQIDLSGIVSLSGTDIPVCALVLANGRSQFSCDGEGHFALKSVPIDSQDQVTLYSWADGFDPYQLVFTPTAAAEEVDVAMSVSPCQGPSGGTTTQHSSLPKASLSGKVFLAGTTIPVCAMLLANGQSQFSCGGDGLYALDDIPTDGNGQVTLFAWAEGFFPYKVVFAPFSIAETRDLPMTPAECGD